MLLNELMEAKEEKEKGTYSAVKFTKESIEALREFVDSNDIQNGLPSKDFHTTVAYSRKVVDIEPLGKIDPPWGAKPVGFEVWGEEKKALVLKLSCKELKARFDEFMNAGATYDFDDYIPHVTLSYDVGDDFDKASLSAKDIPTLLIDKDYIEELDLDKYK